MSGESRGQLQVNDQIYSGSAVGSIVLRERIESCRGDLIWRGDRQNVDFVVVWICVLRRNCFVICTKK